MWAVVGPSGGQRLLNINFESGLIIPLNSV